MPLITDEEYESMTILDWVKLTLVIAITIALLTFFSGCVTLPRCMTC